MINNFQLIKSKSGQDNNASKSEAASYVVDEKKQKKVLDENKIDRKDIEKYSFNLSFPANK